MSTLPGPGCGNYHLSSSTFFPTSFLTVIPRHHHRDFEMEVHNAAVAHCHDLEVHMVVHTAPIHNSDDSKKMI